MRTKLPSQPLFAHQPPQQLPEHQRPPAVLLVSMTTWGTKWCREEHLHHPRHQNLVRTEEQGTEWVYEVEGKKLTKSFNSKLIHVLLFRSATDGRHSRHVTAIHLEGDTSGMVIAVLHHMTTYNIHFVIFKEQKLQASRLILVCTNEFKTSDSANRSTTLINMKMPIIDASCIFLLSAKLKYLNIFWHSYLVLNGLWISYWSKIFTTFGSVIS